jgi:hypothetical protein
VKRLTLVRHLSIGLLVSSLLVPSTAQAQWAVHDFAQFELQLSKRLEEANRWVQHYLTLVDQLTTLGGVLTAADELVAKQRNAVSTMADIGRTIRGAYQLKGQLEAIVISRTNWLKSTKARLDNGIFDPDADLRDLEEYFRNSIGRSSQDTVANYERLMRVDNQLRRMNEDLEKIRALRANTVKKQQAIKGKLDEETEKPDEQKCAPCIGSIKQDLTVHDLLIAQYDEQIEQLMCQIEERKKRYNVQMDERYKFGQHVQSSSQGWTEFNKAMDELNEDLIKVDWSQAG